MVPCEFLPSCNATDRRIRGPNPQCLIDLELSPAPRRYRLDAHALVLQQPALALQPAAILHQRAVGADQAVTGHDRR